MAQNTSMNLRATMFRSRPVACLLSLTASEPQADDRSGKATSTCPPCAWRLHADGMVSFHLRTSRGRGGMTVTIGRRELLAALSGAAAWPLAARAQQSAKVPLVGVIVSGSPPHPFADAF